MFTAEQLIRSGSLPWKINPKKIKQQRAMGGYYFCRDCNNFLGANYVNAFKDFNSKLPEIFLEIKLEKGQRYVVEYEIEGIKPLNIVKHILSMFIAINSIEWGEKHKEILRFVQTPSAKELSNYAVGFFLRRGRFRSDIHSPFTIRFDFLENNIVLSSVASQIDTFKAGYYIEEYKTDLEFGHNLLEYFLDFEINEVADFKCKTETYERNYFIPLDFRTINEIEL